MGSGKLSYAVIVPGSTIKALSDSPLNLTVTTLAVFLRETVSQTRNASHNGVRENGGVCIYVCECKLRFISFYMCESFACMCTMYMYCPRRPQEESI